MKNFLSKIFYVLPAKNITLFYFLILFLLVSGLEVFGIGLIGPFIALASNPKVIDEHPFLELIYERLGFAQETNFIAILGLLIVITFVLKSLFQWGVNSAIFYFSFKQQGELAKKLMRAYLNAPYTFLLTKNSSTIIQNISQYTGGFRVILTNLLSASSNLIVVIALITLLYNVSNFAIIALLTILLPTMILLYLFKNKVKNWGTNVGKANKEIIKIVNHTIGGIKETRVVGCESYFYQQLSDQAHTLAWSSTKFLSFKILPRLMLESLLIVLLIGFTSIFLILHGDIQELIPILGIFSISAIRLVPAINSLVGGVTSLRNATYPLNQLYTDLKEIAQNKEVNPSFLKYLQPVQNNNRQTSHHPALNFQREIKLDNVTYTYPSASEKAISQISLTLSKGKSIALIGKSGAGKTTLVDIILGLLIPQQGDIFVDGQSIYKDLRSWQNSLGYIPQSIFLIDDTIEHNIAFGVSEQDIDQERLNKAIEAAQLTEVVNNLPNGAKTRVGERGVMLSGGQRQRVGIARALYHEREILVLDEATSALDNETEALVTEAIKALSGTKTMIIIAHRLTTVEDCDTVYVMEKGKIIKSGSYEETVSQNT